ADGLGIGLLELNNAIRALGAAGRAALNGTWNVRITDTRGGSNVVQNVRRAQIRLTGNLDTQTDVPVAPTTITTTAFRRNFTGPFPQTTPATPDRGIAPNPVIASDNTLGSFSPNQGNLYIAYAIPHLYSSPANTPPTDDKDIVVLISHDGGASWPDFAIINSDQSIADRSSESTSNEMAGLITGRLQFEPAITVDQSNGTVVATWYDGRQDASRVRLARYIATSIDGGLTWDNGLSQNQTFLNHPNRVTDAI